MAKITKRARSVFQTVEEAQKSPLLQKKGKIKTKDGEKEVDVHFIFAVKHQGNTFYTVAGGVIDAIYNVAKLVAFTGTRLDKAPTKESAAAVFAQLSDEDKAALLKELAGKGKKS
jgi:hypothetical protein